MKKLFVFIFLVTNLTSMSQEFKKHKNIMNLSIDHFGDIFLCEENKIIKIRKNNARNLEYDFSEFGQLKKIITTNPLRTVLFFEESQKIIFLDKNLNKLNTEIKIQQIQNNIISDIETHSNLIFLLSKQTNEICTYDFKKLQITNCNKNIKIKKNKYLKLFTNKENLVILSDNELLILDNNLIPTKNNKIKNCEKIFFYKDSIYLKIKNKLYVSSDKDIENTFFVRNLPENNLLYIKNNILFIWKNNFLIEEELSK